MGSATMQRPFPVRASLTTKKAIPARLRRSKRTRLHVKQQLMMVSQTVGLDNRGVVDIRLRKRLLERN